MTLAAETPWRHGHPTESCIWNDNWHMILSRRLSDEEWTLLFNRLHSVGDGWTGAGYDWEITKRVVLRTFNDVSVRQGAGVEPATRTVTKRY